ncbi:hypothetical protein BDF14DRAFT_1819737 [Spinellus fusiger]|nr:hypothetical protein BDF14DRAFT_1819737 [Spinellus fusiger]
MTAEAIEAVLRYAHVHRYSCEQWAVPTQQCFERANDNDRLDKELCDILLSQLFSLTRMTDPLLESYLTFATTGHQDMAHLLSSIDTSLDPVFISPQVLLTCLSRHVEATASRNPQQWAYFLQLMPVLLTSLDTEKALDTLQQKHYSTNNSDEQDNWVDVLAKVFVMFSRLIVVGMCQEPPSDKDTKPEHRLLRSAFSFQSQGNTQPGDTSALWGGNGMASQNSVFDPEATLEFDTFEQEEEPLETKPEHVSDEKTETLNAIKAAGIMIDLIEKKSAKRLFEVYRQRKVHEDDKEEEEEPWSTCQRILAVCANEKKLTASSDGHQEIQKLLLLIDRLKDSDLEKKMAVHMKYHELEDEGTARAMPSAGLMGILYHIVQIRPTLDDKVIVDHLVKLQAIKGSFDESFYHELWFAALTGLREASFETCCQRQPSENPISEEGRSHKNECSIAIITNRLLWKNLVLVKLPHLIQLLQAHYASNKKSSAKRHRIDENELNALESSLLELKAFTGLLNACSQPACCSDASSHAYQQNNRNPYGEMDPLDTYGQLRGSTTKFASSVAKALEAVSTESIFLSIVNVCEGYGLVRPTIAKMLTQPSTKDSLINCDSLDIDLLDIDQHDDNDWDLEMEDTKQNNYQIIQQNIERRIMAIDIDSSQVALEGILKVALSSLTHFKRVISFFIQLLHEKTAAGNISVMANICGALCAYPWSIDLIIQLYSPRYLMEPLEEFCNQWSPNSDMFISMNCLSDDLPTVQSAYSHFGTVWSFMSYVVDRFNLYRDINCVFHIPHGFTYQFFYQDTLLYDIHSHDKEMESWIGQWWQVLEKDNISDELLKATGPQRLLKMAPSLMRRAMTAYDHNEIQKSALIDILSIFQMPWMQLTLLPSLKMLCEELTEPNYPAAVLCLHQLLVKGDFNPLLMHQCRGYITGSLAGLQEQINQPNKNLSLEETELLAHMIIIQDHIKTTTHTESSNLLIAETVTTRVTRHTLFAKAQAMFRYIVKGGRSMFVKDMEEDASALWDKTHLPKQRISNYLDMVMFQTALEMGGPKNFLHMIVQEVLEAGKSGGAVRAGRSTPNNKTPCILILLSFLAELGSCLIAVPLTLYHHGHNNCVHLLQCLLQDVLPSSLKRCANDYGSFFQGQTMGVFISDCLVLVMNKPSMEPSVVTLGQHFFSNVTDSDTSENPGVVWDKQLMKSAVGRGFVKGLMSNSSIHSVWPEAFIY